MKIIDGGITAPTGFLACGEFIGVKNAKKDLAIIYTEKEAVCAGCFTTNIVKAAPVLWDEKVCKNGVRGVVTVSGCANACTGAEGEANNYKMAEALAKKANAKPENILVCATGVIGTQLPIDIVEKGIGTCFDRIDSSKRSADNAAEAICTTDTFSKQISVQVEIGGKTVKIGGMAKGSGMIHPNMATMLAFVTTDVSITREMLQKALSESVKASYNMISVDGDTSTNDTILVLANGESGNSVIDCENEDYLKFKEALDFVNIKLAKDVVLDGEGATKFVEVNIKGAETDAAAAILSKSIITSSLVKTAIFGQDANWGRVLAAMGYSGAKFNVNDVTLMYKSACGEITLMEKSKPVVFDEEKAKEILKEKEIDINIFLNDGDGNATAWGCDLSYEYVKINGEYRS